MHNQVLKLVWACFWSFGELGLDRHYNIVFFQSADVLDICIHKVSTVTRWTCRASASGVSRLYKVRISWRGSTHPLVHVQKTIILRRHPQSSIMLSTTCFSGHVHCNRVAKTKCCWSNVTMGMWLRLIRIHNINRCLWHHPSSSEAWGLN